MPDYNITTPDGQKYKVTAPEGATQEQVLSYAKDHHESQPGFLSRVGQDVEKRANEGADAIVAYKNNEQGAGPKDSDAEYFKKNTYAGNMITGAEESGVDIMRGSRWLGEKLYGKDPHDAAEKAAFDATDKKLKSQEGAGVGNAVARFAGDPLNYVGGAFAKEAKLGEKAIEAAKEAGKNIGEGGKIIKEGYHARTPEVLDNVALKYEAAAGKHFSDMRKSGVTMKPEITMKAAENVEKALTLPEKGKLNPHLHGETMKVLADMKNHATKGFDVEDLDQYRRRLSEVAGKARRAGNNEDAKKASDAIEAIDEQFENMKKTPGLPPDVAKSIDSLQSAQKIWSARRKFETLSDAIKRGEGDPNKIASEFDKILHNPKLHRGFTDEQMKAVEAVAKNTTTEGLLKMAGKFGITVGTGRAAATGNIIPALEVIGGTMVHGAGLPGYAAVLGGTAAKQVYKYGKAGKAERALKSIGADEALGAETSPLAVGTKP